MPGQRATGQAQSSLFSTLLAEDIGFYGRWMRDRAFERIGHIYPKVTLPAEEGGGEANVIARIWARTVRSPDPAWNSHVPLVRSRRCAR